ncbi:MAG: tRNA pseudouridine(38-40) synthase TruA [Candidatus Atribacteria bacterium]|nr:tRNA pseudouridine(38-40) synthase TruA [Candidatus Atribacteria bacterium]
MQKLKDNKSIGPKKKNLVMVIEYDGTNYFGWQSQPNRNSIQSVLTQALTSILNQPITLHASGRTDAGVHALGQVANCRVELTLEISTLFRALNSYLPPDIRVIHLQEVSLSFNARKDATSKEYHYWMYSGNQFPVFLRHYMFYPGNYKINWPLLKECINLFVGEHDFTAFSASGSTIRNMVRQIHRFEVYDFQHGFLSFQIVGNGFLYKMVRILLGEIWMVQLGKKKIDDLRLALSQPNRGKHRLCLPPHGLYLARVFYPEYDFWNSNHPSPSLPFFLSKKGFMI